MGRWPGELVLVLVFVLVLVSVLILLLSLSLLFYHYYYHHYYHYLIYFSQAARCPRTPSFSISRSLVKDPSDPTSNQTSCIEITYNWARVGQDFDPG